MYTYLPGSLLDVTFSSMIGGGSIGFLSAYSTAVSNHSQKPHFQLGRLTFLPARKGYKGFIWLLANHELIISAVG